jgi:hypothetical protein
VASGCTHMMSGKDIMWTHHVDRWAR